MTHLENWLKFSDESVILFQSAQGTKRIGSCNFICGILLFNATLWLSLSICVKRLCCVFTTARSRNRSYDINVLWVRYSNENVCNGFFLHCF